MDKTSFTVVDQQPPNNSVERTVLVSRLRAQNFTFREIAQQLGVSVSTVHADMQKVKEDWKSRAAEHYEETVARELEVLDAVESEAWKAWRNSIGENVTFTEKRKGVGQDAALERQQVKKQLNGDPRYLTIIKDVSEQRAALLSNLKGDGVGRRTLDSWLQEARNGASMEFYERKVSINQQSKS